MACNWDENLVNLNYVLAGLYPMMADSVRIANTAGVPSAFIAFQPRAIDNWHAILDEACKRDRVRAVIEAARRDYPDDPALKRAEEGKLRTVRGPVIGEDVEWKPA